MVVDKRTTTSITNIDPHVLNTRDASFCQIISGNPITSLHLFTFRRRQNTLCGQRAAIAAP